MPLSTTRITRGLICQRCVLPGKGRVLPESRQGPRLATAHNGANRRFPRKRLPTHNPTLKKARQHERAAGPDYCGAGSIETLAVIEPVFDDDFGGDRLSDERVARAL